MQTANDLANRNRELLNQVSELEQNLTLIQATIDGQRDVLIFSIDRDYTYRNFNTAFQSATSHAYGTEVKTGMNLLDSITSETDRTKARTNCDRALAGESHRTIEEYGTINPLIYETHYNPITTHGKVIGVSVFSSNVTERVTAERRVMTLSKELESFTYSAAHDLRVPLRIVNGYSKILAEDHKHVLDDEGKKLVGIIITQVTHMGRLIDDLLNFAQLGRATITPRQTSLRDIAQQAIDEQALLANDSKTRFVIGDLPLANCDPALMRIVFSNLISNAMKFSSQRDKPLVEIGTEQQGKATVIFVRDNGIGFNMDYSSKLFGLFQRLHKPAEFEGTGVGLAIVQRIIGKHGGKVWFDAELGKGATFYFSL